MKIVEERVLEKKLLVESSVELLPEKTRRPSCL